MQKKVAVLPPKISIKSKNHDKNDDYIISQIEKPHEPFDKEKLIAVIDTYANAQEKLNRKSMAFTVKAGEPVIKNEDTILLTLFNSSQEVEFNKHKEEFTQFLRDKLNNQFVSIQTEVKEKEETIHKTIDPSVKIDYMVQENPLLLEFMKTFKLNI